MGIKIVPHPPNSVDLSPCDFWLFTKLRGCRYKTTEEMKEAVTRFIDTLTLPWGLPEVVGRVQQAHFSRSRSLLRGLEYQACTVNKNKKICKLVYIYIYSFNMQLVKSRVIPWPHKPPTRGDNTVSIAQGSTASPRAAKQLLPWDRVLKRIIYIYIYIYILFF